MMKAASRRPPGLAWSAYNSRGPGGATMEAASFNELLQHARAGNQQAAALLVRRYEPTIRRIVRLRLATVPLTALLDSTDICQSVLVSFFARLHVGEYSLETPEQLVNLLATVARSKVAAQVRRQQAQ